MRLPAFAKKAFRGGIVAALVLAMPAPALACTQVYIGKNQTTTGDTYVGRAEDYSPRYCKTFGVQQPIDNPVFRSFENDSVPGTGFEYTYQGRSYRYTYVRDNPDEWDAQDDEAASRVYSEAGTNERGVSVSATLTTDYNDGIDAIDPRVDTGIGEYNLADYLLSVSSTARDGVEKLGAIIDQYGSQDCNQIVIADNAETWIFAQLSGHQWIAVKMGNDVASVNPNIGGLQYKVDLDDASQCLHSADVVTLPESNGVLVTYDDGTPNIFKTYGKENSGSSQNTRLAQGRAYFGAALAPQTDYTVDEQGRVTSLIDPQLTFTPGIKSDTFTALRSLAARGEQDDSLNANLNSALYAIGNNRTTEGNIFQIRSGLSSDIATIQWEALSRCEFSVYLPSYSALLTEVPADYFPAWNTVDGTYTGRKDDVAQALVEKDGKNLDYVFMDINTLAYNNRASMGENVRAYLDVLQKQVIAQQDVVDGLMQATPADQRTDLANKAFAAVSEQVYNKAAKLLDEMRAYVNAGDTSSAFMPSDYDAENGTSRTPIMYASAFVAPSITAQPQSVTCAQGAEAKLSVAATVDDSVDGSDAQLTYQWFVKGEDGNFSAIDGATAAEYVAATTEVGSKVYRVEVTSAAGLVSTSDEATVTVTQAAQEEPGQKPGQKTDVKTDVKADTAKKATKGGLAKTGDSSVVTVALLTVAGVLAVMGAVLIRKRAN